MTTASGLNCYYTLGRTGLRVSRLALGTMTFGTDWGWGADKDTAQQQLAGSDCTNTFALLLRPGPSAIAR
jgi:hypothetical protein